MKSGVVEIIQFYNPFAKCKAVYFGRVTRLKLSVHLLAKYFVACVRLCELLQLVGLLSGIRMNSFFYLITHSYLLFCFLVCFERISLYTITAFILSIPQSYFPVQ